MIYLCEAQKQNQVIFDEKIMITFLNEGGGSKGVLKGINNESNVLVLVFTQVYTVCSLCKINQTVI